MEPGSTSRSRSLLRGLELAGITRYTGTMQSDRKGLVTFATRRILTLAIVLHVLVRVDGGDTDEWDPAYSADLDHGICNIRKVDLIGGADQLHSSNLLAEPVIFRRKAGADANKLARQLCTKQELLRRCFICMCPLLYVWKT
jgi:hypothetical protein